MPPFVRVSRDRRGYEHTYLFQVRTAGGRAGRPRLVYWFRTPPGVRLGRPAFDPTMREAIQAQYPDQSFDWEKFEAIPPPPEVENWRERRRLEKAAKRARAAEAAEPEGDADGDEADQAQAASSADADGASSTLDGADDGGERLPAAGVVGQAAEGDAGTASPRQGRRRGRRRGRGRARDGELRGHEAAAPDGSPLVGVAAERADAGAELDTSVESDAAPADAPHTEAASGAGAAEPESGS